jgi:predicted regulator of Ras-like GTPase activity (Roadblock/LC7/MglB family)
MQDVLSNMLVRLRADNDLDLAAITADGLLVAADFADGLDSDAICATASDGYLMMAALGQDLQRGEQIMLTIDYANGSVLICPFEHGAVLVMLTGAAVNLGRLRLAARRFQAQYLEATAVAV